MHQSIEGIRSASTIDGPVVCEYAEGWLRDGEIKTAGFCAASRDKPIHGRVSIVGQTRRTLAIRWKK